eukprot:Skav235065  [mRNA]  locus=scaffold2047:64845:66066:+ [translate_table: standard]
MFRTHSTPSLSSQSFRSDPSSPPRSRLERQVPCLDGLSSPFTELSLAKQSAMRLPPLERQDVEDVLFLVCIFRGDGSVGHPTGTFICTR